MRWECRYSLSEVLYLEIAGDEVRCYLHHSPQSALRWTFEQVLAGEMDKDPEVRALFGDEIDEVKAAVRERLGRKS
jgi:hypothetical protein